MRIPGTRARRGALLALIPAAAGLLALVHRHDPSPAAEPPRVATASLDGLEIGFSLSPNRPGRNLVTVDVRSIGGPGLTPVRGVTVRLRPAGDASSRQIVAAPTLRPDVYDGGAVDVRAPGDLEVEVSVSRAGLPVTSTALAWRVDAGSEEHR